MKRSAAPRVQHVQIDRDHAGRRIDNFLFSLLKGVPKSRIYRILRKGEVRVNKSRVKQDYKLSLGDDVRIPPIRLEEKTEHPINPELAGNLTRSVIYESEDLLVLNKPGGIPVHAGSGFDYGVIEVMRHARDDLQYLELAHRLDRDTSGCLLLVKKPPLLRAINNMIRADAMNKRYTALLCGEWQGDERDVNVPLRKNVLQGGERMVTVDREGKPARSIFLPLAHYGSLATLMKIDLITGRTHQIRVHAQHCGHPLAGDGKYGDRDSNKQLRALGLKGLFLHAGALSFRHPVTNEELHFEAELPNQHGVLLDKLREI